MPNPRKEITMLVILVMLGWCAFIFTVCALDDICRWAFTKYEAWTITRKQDREGN